MPVRITSKRAVRLILAMAACLLAPSGTRSQAGWIPLFDGSTLKGWQTVGDANWKVSEGSLEATAGSGFLVTEASYRNFELIAEFWVDEPANSGVFLRCSDLKTIDQNTAYEVNIYDTRPDQTYATGAIVDVAPPAAPQKAAGKWNTYQITANGPHLTVTFNGIKTVDVVNQKFAAGPIAIQRTLGVVRFRTLKLRAL